MGIKYVSQSGCWICNISISLYLLLWRLWMYMYQQHFWDLWLTTKERSRSELRDWLTQWLSEGGGRGGPWNGGYPGGGGAPYPGPWLCHGGSGAGPATKQVMYKDKSFFKIFSVCLFAFMHTLIPSLSPHQGAYLFQASLRGDLIEMGAYLIVFIRHQRLENSLANVQ